MFPNLTTVASYLLLPLLGLDFNKTITYYETTIAQSVIKSTTYKLDEDASKYKPKNDQIEGSIFYFYYQIYIYFKLF